MIRKVSLRLLTTVACASVMTMVCSAQAPLTHHVWDFITDGRAPLVGHLPGSQNMRLVLALPLRNQPALQSFLQDLYNPSSPSFHQFLTVSEFTAAYGPTQADYNALIGFAQTHGLTVVNTSVNRVNLRVTGTAAAVEAAFHVSLGLYKDPDSASRTFYSPNVEPTPDLSIPLWHITGLDNYAIPHPALQRLPAGATPNATTGSCPEASFCGSDMRAAYYGGTLTGTGQYLGLLEFYGTDLADFNTYFTNAGQTNTVPIDLLSVDGTSTSCLDADGCDDTEQTIDMTQAVSMAPGLAKLTMFIGDSDPLDDSGILNAMATTEPLSAQLSSSWTWRPQDSSTDDPYFEEFAAQGQNFFNAAGDSRKWSKSTYTFPSDDVYVTSVGGTDLTTVSAGGAWASETGWSDSGGGISPDKFAIPSWQVATAAGCTSCSQTYRNGPDVSGNANYTFYVCADQTTCSANLYGGTSFATPMWAAYLALANEQNVANYGATLGFINPTLYTTGLGSTYDANFHDITSGNNGFSATVGYDLVTGWGSPNGPALINTLSPLPSASFTLKASSGTVSIAEGTSGKQVITSTIAGTFDSAIALTASGMPTGVHVVFSPTSIPAPGAGSAGMAIKVGKVTPANYTITVTGTGGGLLESTSFTLTVTK